MPPLDISFHPTDLIPGLIFCAEGNTLTAEEKEKLKDVEQDMGDTKELLCRACGWNNYHELCTSYVPRLRIFHAKVSGALWFLGNDWLLWDRTTSKTTGNDYMVHRFLKEQGSQDIPMVKEMFHCGNAGDPFQFTVMSRAKGVPLSNIWASLSPEVKKGYAQQITAALRELRQHTSPVPRLLDRSPLPDSVIGRCMAPAQCKHVGKDKEEWIGGMADELRVGIKRLLNTDNDAAVEARLQELKDKFPENAPYVLTHGDLHFGNIIVHDGKIEAIIDWETAGYYPWWVERYTSYSHSINRGSDDLFDSVWTELDPDLTLERFSSEVALAVADVGRAWTACEIITHTESHDAWFRPAWCECKPIGGMIGRKDVESELKHKIGWEGKMWPLTN